MRYADIDQRAVRHAIEQLGSDFRTKDISRQQHMLDAHRGGTDRNYHAAVGGYLSANSVELGIRLVARSSGDRGASFEKVGGAPAVDGGPVGPATHADDDGPVGPATLAEDDGPVGPATLAEGVDIGPQYSGDRPLAARMRWHQSWYRANVLRVPCGTGPKPGSTKRYGNMLRREDGERGLNFLTPAIHAAAKRRVAERRGTIEPFRLMHNMLSSQPMCFNIMAPLQDDLDLATRLMSALLPGEVARVREVAIEWAPEPAEEYLADRTAFDAFVSYDRPDGSLAFVGIETKLTEPFSVRRDDGPAYRRWMELPDAPWRPDAWDRVTDVSHNQLWRDHLLAWSLLRHERSRYSDGRLMLIRHPLDTDCERTVTGYRALLRDEHTFFDMPLDRLVDAWSAELPGDAWLGELRGRYVELSESA